MINEVISKSFAEFVIDNLKNNNRYEGVSGFINVGIYKRTEVVVSENNDNKSGKIETSKDVYAWLLLEYNTFNIYKFRRFRIKK